MDFCDGLDITKTIWVAFTCPRRAGLFSINTFLLAGCADGVKMGGASDSLPSRIT